MGQISVAAAVDGFAARCCQARAKQGRRRLHLHVDFSFCLMLGIDLREQGGRGMAGKESDRAIALIYSALLGEIEWQGVVDEVAAATHSDFATLFYHDAKSGSGAITLASGIPEAVQRDYASHFAPLNPWMEQVASTPIGLGVVGEQIVSRDRFLRTEYYNDFLRLQDQESGVGVTVRRDDDCFFLFSVLSGDSDFERNSGRAAYLTRIAPHLRRVSDFHVNRKAPLGGDLARELGQLGGIAVVVVNVAGKVIHASQRGEACLAGGDVLGVDAAGRVSFRDSMAQSVFSHALRGRYGDLITRRIAAGDADVTFVRVAEDNGSAIFLGGALAILIATRRVVPGAQAMAVRFRLTPAETRVLEGILDGRRPGEIAGVAGVSVETVRSQLKAIYGKTGANSQSALVRIAAGFADSGNDGHAAPRKLD
ncbi:LuxR C-terminal-related transcriptional regulator [Mesorhizobium sp. ZMM04-5]|uniref:LuxR C-terminal-related transcriptional regulator n=1 Tax=Mesorhizobium marinum TaxID=3228790 RepID=A0ABV3R2N4_9HYPH